MNRDKKLCKIVQHVWDFVSFKIVLTTEPPVIKASTGINSEMASLLRMVVWTGMYVSLSEWRSFIYDHYVRMTTSPKNFATYVLYALYITKQTSEQNNLDAFQIFLRTMSLVLQLALYSNEDRQEEFLFMSRDFYIEFFESEMREGFIKQGGWNALLEYLQERNPMQLFKMLERWEEDGYTPGQVVRILGMVNTTRDPLREHLSRGIESSEVESYPQSSRILDSLDFLKYAKLDLNNTSKKPESASSTQSGRITTKQVFLKAKSIMQELRSDFQTLQECIEFVFDDGKKSRAV